jgi:hypothetical protein
VGPAYGIEAQRATGTDVVPVHLPLLLVRHVYTCITSRATNLESPLSITVHSRLTITTVVTAQWDKLAEVVKSEPAAGAAIYLMP